MKWALAVGKEMCVINFWGSRLDMARKITMHSAFLGILGCITVFAVK